MAQTFSRPPFKFNDANTDIFLRSADRVDFGLSKVRLAKISTVFCDMFAFPDVNADTGEPQIVELTENASTLAKLLRLCYYPIPVRRICTRRPVFEAFDELFAVLNTADKYDIEVPADATRRALQELAVKEGPAQTYAVACRYKIPMLARKAARLLLREPYFTAEDTDTMPPELRSLPEEALDALDCYREQCADHIAANVLHAEKEQLLVGGHAYDKSRRERDVTHVQGSWIWYRCKAGSPRTSVDARSNDSSNPDQYIHPCGWWLRYKWAVFEEFINGDGGLDGCVATKWALLHQFISEGENCRTCAPSARTHLMVYAQAMEKRIERAIDEIEFDLPFAVRPGAGWAWVPSR